ncbi:sigma-70 family RNA polymerase sigma factor [Actinoplanes sp. NPDC026623]|uniref:RNA polymerase sigma factor n=1 Tax=Actinoplanes sp. NPDC026623 TaxID=3155610 RepID=UPI0033DA9140
MLAATVRVTRNVDLAEECVQEAYAGALAAWPADGVPANPIGWLTTTARRRAIDAIRRHEVYLAKLALLSRPDEHEPEPAEPDPGPECVVPDERLRLIFLCCHPALAPDAQPALTLRLVCGLTTREIAHAFLVPEPTMAARLTRAKKKISAARIPFRIPPADELAGRLGAVLGVIHLLFTTGHTAPVGTALVRAGLTDQALHLARTLRDLMPGEREVRGLLALLLVTDARRATRVDAHGRLVRLEQQDRSRWDRAAIAEAHDLIVDAIGGVRPGRYVLQAAIAALYAQAPAFEQTDWPQIVTLYDHLLRVWPSPVAALNRTVALARVDGPGAALLEIGRLEHDGRLAGYRYLPAIKADLLQRLGRIPEAGVACRQALDLTANETEREFLTGRLAELDLP